MKQMIKIILIILMSMTLFGCSSASNDDNQSSQKENQQEDSNIHQENGASNKNHPITEKWGVACRMIKLSDLTYVNISFPEHPGDEYGTGMFASQPDHTITIFDVYCEGISPEVDDIKELFPTYGERVKPLFENTYSFDYDNSSFEAEYDGTETIGSYEVTKFRGVHHYTLEDAEKNCQFVVYAVELHKGGEYAYVMVQDISKEQSQLELIESHAYNMIRSMREE